MKVVLVALSTAVWLLVGGIAEADERYYVWTYDYSSLAKGNSEIEYYMTSVVPDRQVSRRTDWQQQVELEYGITDHLDVGLYQVFEQPVGDNLHYEGFKFKLRYRISEKDQFPLDVVLYAEHEERTSESNVFEGKLILAKDIGRFNVAYNQIYERVYNTGDKENEYAAGVSYEIAPSLRVGVESKGSYTEGEYAAGPTVAWSGGRIWANLGAVYGLNRNTNDREVRFLLGIPF